MQYLFDFCGRNQKGEQQYEDRDRVLTPPLLPPDDMKKCLIGPCGGIRTNAATTIHTFGFEPITVMEKETDLEWPCDEWLLSPDTLELIYKYRAGLPLLLDRDVKKLKKQVAMEQEEKRRNTVIKAAEVVGVEVEGEMNKGAKQSQPLQGESAGAAAAPKQVLSAGVVHEPVQQAAGVELQDRDNEDPSMIRIKEEPVSSDEECEKVAVEQKVKDFLTHQHEQTFQQRLAANYFGFETPKNLTNGRSKEQNKATFHNNARAGPAFDLQENGQNGIEGAAGEQQAGIIPIVNHAEEAKKKFTKAQLFLVNQIDRSEHFCYTPILHAIEENNDAAVQWLLQHGAILPAGLPQASERNAFEIKFLMEHGIDRYESAQLPLPLICLA